MESQNNQIYIDCFPSFNESDKSYTVDIRLRGEFADETVRRTIEKDTFVMLVSPNCDIEPLSSRFVSCDEGYRVRSLFQLYPHAGAENPVSKVRAVLLVKGEPIHSSNFNIADILQE